MARGRPDGETRREYFDTVVELAMQGHPPREIHARIGGVVDTKSISNWISAARSRGADIPKAGRGGLPGARPAELRDICVPNCTVTKLSPHARRRGISVEALIQDLLYVLAESRLVDAVLDDKEDAA